MMGKQKRAPLPSVGHDVYKECDLGVKGMEPASSYRVIKKHERKINNWPLHLVEWLKKVSDIEFA